MSIMFHWNNRIFRLAIGYKTPWFEQKYFIFIDELFYDETGHIDYLVIVWHS